METRSYSLPEGKLKALTALMVRPDVPVLVSPGKKSIEVQGTPDQHAIFGAFVNLIHPDGDDVSAAAADRIRALAMSVASPGEGLVRAELLATLADHKQHELEAHREALEQERHVLHKAMEHERRALEEEREHLHDGMESERREIRHAIERERDALERERDDLRRSLDDERRAIQEELRAMRRALDDERTALDDERTRLDDERTKLDDERLAVHKQSR